MSKLIEGFLGKECIVRTRSAGVFAGQLAAYSKKAAVVTQARRLYYWSGAATLSELSLHGVATPTECQFPQAVPSVFLPEVIEVLILTQKASESIKAVPVWSAQ